MASLLPLYQLATMVNGWFASLPAPTRDQILTRARRRVLEPRQRLFSRGDKPDGIYGVLEGCVCLSGISGQSRKTVLDFYGPGVWFGEVTALDGLPRTHDAEAYGSTVLLQVTPADLEELLATDPALSRNLLRLEALRLRMLLTAIESYSIQSLEQRLADRLLMLTVSYGVTSSQGLKIGFHLPQEILAQLIGATRQRVNQILKAWESEGIIQQQYGDVTLLDRARLENVAHL